ncbi:cysteine desulfurase [Bradyrhizobium ontarionense]|uniref:Cysteine desulfurase n=1 Tax=Bradyrhizobium ontarionense TaxID=2898149 RepID=A0ABY3RDZ6_9BRAD|nr:cysteine desulfurase family protein [Bradyrhizobium sp. A19]UFZ05518.1 cysteine desulfurase [Bradyrhizobium sp. A19]
MSDRIYLDWNATTPLRPEAREAMVAAMDLVGNPSSVHAEGRKARRLVEDAREAIARSLATVPRRVVFTSGGTEANVLALSPDLKAPAGKVGRLLMSAVEHASVLAGGRFPLSAVQTIPVDPSGVVDLGRLKTLLAGGPPALVSVMAANNETGVLQPVSQAADLVRQAGGLLHVDAIQAFGKISFDINEVGADLVTISAHKIGGPKGVGALVLGVGVDDVAPLLRGGGQERGRRAGTENVIGIAGLGAAAKAALAGIATDQVRIGALRDRLELGLRQTPGVTVFSSQTARLPNSTLFTAPGLKAETAVIGFDLEGIAVSSGSACSSGKVQPSHVLEAMGVSSAAAQGAVRLSLGWSTAEADVDRCVKAWRKLSLTLLKGRDETVVERF